MTYVEARKIVKILLHADGECPYCAAVLVAHFTEQFPAWREIAESLYRAKWPDRAAAYNCRH